MWGDIKQNLFFSEILFPATRLNPDPELQGLVRWENTIRPESKRAGFPIPGPLHLPLVRRGCHSTWGSCFMSMSLRDL